MENRIPEWVIICDKARCFYIGSFFVWVLYLYHTVVGEQSLALLLQCGNLKTKETLYSIVLCCIAFHTIKAQTPMSKAESSIVGVWKGVSECRVKDSLCHDEIVVYRISKAPGIDTFYISASKIVNGEDVRVGIKAFRFDKMTNQLLSNSDNASWTFTFRGNILEGALTYHGKLYRVISAGKKN